MTEQSRSENPEPITANDAPESDKNKFETQFAPLMNQLSEAWKDAGSPASIAIMIDPKEPNTPVICQHGHPYDVAQLLAWALRKYKENLLNPLQV